MVRTFLKVYMELGSYFLFLQEQIKDIIIGDHTSTNHSGATKAHDWMVSVLGPLAVRP
jgi:hypothetical protein